MRKKTVMFGKFGPLETLKAAYNDGYRTGRKWPAHWDHIPGGPFVVTARTFDRDPNWIAYCEHSQKVHDEWMRGWHRGKANLDKARQKAVDHAVDFHQHRQGRD